MEYPRIKKPRYRHNRARHNRKIPRVPHVLREIPDPIAEQQESPVATLTKREVFVERHVRLALAHPLVTSLQGLRRMAAEKLLLFYWCTPLEEGGVVPAVRAVEDVQADILTVSQAEREAINHGISAARRALSKTFEAAGGTPRQSSANEPRPFQRAPQKVLTGITPLAMPHRVTEQVA